MRIGVIGAGNIGGVVGQLWVRAGHEVRFASRHPEVLSALAAGRGSRASTGAPEDAAAFGDVVFCSVPYGAWPDLARQIASHVRGKVVIDSANPYPERDGAFAREVLDAGEGSGIPIARLLPGARLVRAFNSVFYKTLASEAFREDDPVGIPLAGDDAAALDATAALVREAGFVPIVVGPLVRARDFDVGTPVYNTGVGGRALAKALGLES